VIVHTLKAGDDVGHLSNQFWREILVK
jgi:hypothetical protein